MLKGETAHDIINGWIYRISLKQYFGTVMVSTVIVVYVELKMLNIGVVLWFIWLDLLNDIEMASLMI